MGTFTGGSDVSAHEFDEFRESSLVYNAIFSKNYKYERELGFGSFGVAILCRRKSDESYCVVKCVRACGQDYREVLTTPSLQHKNLIEIRKSWLYGTIETQRVLLIEMEYCEQGSIKDLIAYKRNDLAYDQCWRIFFDVLDALVYLHGQGFMHKDLSTGNILLHKDGTTKVADFGTIKNVDLSGFDATAAVAPLNDSCTGTAGTKIFQAPKDSKYSVKSDIFSLGRVLCQMLAAASSGFPVTGLWTVEGLKEATNNPSFCADYKDREFAISVIEWLTREDPKKRPYASSLNMKNFLLRNRPTKIQCTNDQESAADPRADENGTFSEVDSKWKTACVFLRGCRFFQLFILFCLAIIGTSILGGYVKVAVEDPWGIYPNFLLAINIIRAVLICVATWLLAKTVLDLIRAYRIPRWEDEFMKFAARIYWWPFSALGRLSTTHVANASDQSVYAYVFMDEVTREEFYKKPKLEYDSSTSHPFVMADSGRYIKIKSEQTSGFKWFVRLNPGDYVGFVPPESTYRIPGEDLLTVYICICSLHGDMLQWIEINNSVEENRSVILTKKNRIERTKMGYIWIDVNDRDYTPQCPTNRVEYEPPELKAIS